MRWRSVKSWRDLWDYSGRPQNGRAQVWSGEATRPGPGFGLVMFPGAEVCSPPVWGWIHMVPPRYFQGLFKGQDITRGDIRLDVHLDLSGL